MKQTLLTALKVLDNEQVFVVTQQHYHNINGGDLIWIAGAWCEFLWCNLERTLYHVRFIKDGVRYTHTVRQNTFLVRLD